MEETTETDRFRGSEAELLLWNSIERRNSFASFDVCGVEPS